MLTKFFASLLANISKDLLMDLFKAILVELILKEDKAELSKAVDHLKKVIDETKESEMSDDEKNKLLINAGRDVANRMRKR